MKFKDLSKNVQKGIKLTGLFDEVDKNKLKDMELKDIARIIEQDCKGMFARSRTNRAILKAILRDMIPNLITIRKIIKNKVALDD